ncbi:hypothetical protein LDENG_00226170 [Lucifuga dentata]|nr:hypothetical protein LDENG_00226170 [Lucifuga dentata]
MQGYRWLHLRAIQRGYVVSQDTIRQLIKLFDPVGVELRRAWCLRCRHYHNRGPNAFRLYSQNFDFILEILPLFSEF